MSPALLKMWISLAAMGFMFISIILIYLVRFKFSNKWLKGITGFVAYSLMFLSGIIIFFVVLSGPTNN